MTNIPEIFGCMVFNDTVMRQRLPKDVYKSLTETIQTGKMIDVSIANVVANAMMFIIYKSRIMIFFVYL